ncbi:MAG: low temperature requirement protein A [Actinomycetota bacterium]|nr:low temperature requirement protein A [Actinomycetota bacterium]
MEGDSYERRVSPLELFFDLVFVFALTQITAFLASHLTWGGVLQGLALLAALWGAWTGYSWLTNAVPADDAIPARLIILSAMGAMLVASLAVPGAFGRDGVIFGLAYFVVRLLGVALQVLSAWHTPDERRAILRLAPGFLVGPALLVVAGFLDDSAQGALWFLALVINFGGPFVFGVLGFKIHAGHFVERHGLIIIIALGESIVAIGVGASEVGLGAGVILASLLGVAVAASLWWAYFDYVVLLAERRLSGARGHERARLARDSYSYLHLPMLAGIVFVALGVKKTLAHIGDPLGTIPAVALCGGVALYLLGHNAFRLRDAGSVSVLRLVVAALSCALIPVGTQVPAILTLGTLAALLVAFVAAETLYWREDRGKLRTH